MSQSFIACDRNQEMLMPPSLLDWVPGDHLVWTILGSVEEMDLDAFYGAYRADGHGRPAYEPSMMVALVLYAYARGNRSSRGIERECREDVVYKLITAMRVPDHSTIAEFRRRHQTALADLFTSVLSLCREAGLVSVGVIAIDGTKVAANASRDRNKSYRRIVHEILEEAERADREEDEQYGDARGDELPEEMHTPEGRRAAIRAAKQRLEQHDAAEGEGGGDRDDGSAAGGDGETAPKQRLLELDTEAIIARSNGRDAWLSEARAQLSGRREQRARPIPRSRGTRLLEAARRLEQDHAAQIEANEAYECYRATGRDTRGRRLSCPPKPYEPPAQPEEKINTTDPDSRLMKTLGHPAKQGYNAQAAVNENQIIVAAEVFCRSGDFGHLGPMVEATERELQAIGVTNPADAVVADPGYWDTSQIEDAQARGMQVLIPPESRLTQKVRKGWESGPYQAMRDKLATDSGDMLYKKRKETVEPVYGQIKYNRRIDRFLRRGHAAARSEWRLATATHNLLKLHSHRAAASTA